MCKDGMWQWVQPSAVSLLCPMTLGFGMGKGRRVRLCYLWVLQFPIFLSNPFTHAARH